MAIEEQVETIVLMQEKTAQLTHLEEPQLALAAKLDTGHALLDLPLFEGVLTPTYLLSRYLNLETLTRIQGPAAFLAPRAFDDKFHILMSQSLFSMDLRYFRQQCLLRNRPVSVGYIDIDNFGKFNRELPGKETQVDKEILPRFMSALEAFVFGRGFAYREGGDEYLVLLPGATYSEAARFFDSLREDLACIVYPIEIPGPTVSIGICTAEASERLTDLQIQRFANKAKAFAKDGGRNRVGGYKKGLPRSDSTRTIISTSSHQPR
jgi:diguanylate cyclase (GGDEF)-like protein